MEQLWGFVVIGGPIILGLLLLIAYLRNRQSKVSKSVTEEATRRNYEAEDREVKRKEGEL